MLLCKKATKANHVFVPGVGGGKYVLPLDYVGIRPHNMVLKCAWIRSVGTHATVNLVNKTGVFDKEVATISLGE